MPYQRSDHFDGSRFHNLNHATTDKSFLTVLKWMLFEKSKEWPEWVDDNVTPQLAEASQLSETEARVTTVNHATHLIQIKKLNILTDPVYSKRTSPFSWVGPKRRRKPGIEFENLPPIDVVVISHNHYDHLDVKTIRRLAKKMNPLFIVPLGNAELLKENGVQKVIELDWWQSYELPDTRTKIHLTPCQHWSNRGLFDRNKTLWAAFVIESPTLKIYFGGDTGYNSHFTKTRERLGEMDISILPIGAYEPRWFMKEQHINPAEAVQAHIDLKSKLSIGTHFGTFKLTNEAIDDPEKDLKIALKEKNISENKFLAPKNGQTVPYKK